VHAVVIDLAKLEHAADIDCQCGPDDHSYEDDFDDAKTRAWIADQLEAGNEWAWCYVTVRVSYIGHHIEEHLGGCSYQSKRDFEKGGYYEDMVRSCLKELAKKLEGLVEAHEVWDHQSVPESVCLWCAAE
jgi:hypothetical protein